MNNKILNKNEKLIISFLGPSASGKDTISKKVAEILEMKEIISTTTRKKREGEKDGVNYYYVDKETFSDMIENNSLIEHSQYPHFDKDAPYYGMSVSSFEEALNFDIAYCVVDYKGLLEIKKRTSSFLSFYIDVNSKVLHERMINRGDEEESIKKRLKQIEYDLNIKEHCDYIIENIDLSNTVEKIVSIIKDRADNK